MRTDFEDKSLVHNNCQFAEAVRLSRPGSIRAPDEIKVISAAADAIESRGGPTTKDEERVVQSAMRLRVYTPAREGPADPPEWLQRLATATATLAGAQLLKDKTLGDLAVAQQRAGRGANDPAESARLNAVTKVAELAYEEAREKVDRAGRVVSALHAERNARRRAAALAAHATSRHDPGKRQ